MELAELYQSNQMLPQAHEAYKTVRAQAPLHQDIHAHVHT
jgi:hypothetical protein